MTSLGSLEKPYLAMVEALREAGFPELAAYMVVIGGMVLLVTMVCGGFHYSVRFLSHKDMHPVYKKVGQAALWLWKAFLGPDRNIEKIKALTLFGKIRNWILVILAAGYGGLFLAIGSGVLTLMVLHHATIPNDILARGIFCSMCSLGIAKLLVRDVRRLWPIA